MQVDLARTHRVYLFERELANNRERRTGSAWGCGIVTQFSKLTNNPQGAFGPGFGRGD
jgi:hypothetical protein